MNLLRSLQNLAELALLRGVQALARAAGQGLLGVQAALAWLDGPHPLAARLQALTRHLARHSRTLSVTLGTGLLAIGGGAFAVASLGPDAAELPVATLSEPITVPDLQAQADALEMLQGRWCSAYRGWTVMLQLG